VSTPKHPAQAQLFLSVLSARMDDLWEGFRHTLVERFGPMEYLSDPFSFAETEYYDDELGTPILRRIIGFERLVEQDSLPGIKLWTNALEMAWASSGKRLFNLDPGLLTLERLVLATGKNFTHRIYLGAGIWGDLTLIYTKGDWQTLPWTFPDYAGPVMREHLDRIRVLYAGKCASQRTPQEL
jgi:hypothetical protein